MLVWIVRHGWGWVLTVMISNAISHLLLTMWNSWGEVVVVACYFVCISIINRVRPIPFWRPIPDTIGRSCTDTDTDTGNDGTYSLRQTYLTYVAHTVCTFQNIMLLTLRFETFETIYRLETIVVHATVLTVETGKWTTGIGTDTKISIGWYRYPPILASIGRYPIPVSV